MLASTIQFSHNTPHHQPHTHFANKAFSACFVMQAPGPTHNSGLLSQTPNSAPMSKPRFNLACVYVSQEFVLAASITAGVFPLRFKLGGMTTLGSSTTNTRAIQLHSCVMLINISSLERRRSSRTYRYVCLVTPTTQSPIPPSTAT